MGSGTTGDNRRQLAITGNNRKQPTTTGNKRLKVKLKKRRNCVRPCWAEALCRGRKEYEPPRFMTCATCARQMLEVEEKRGEGVYGPHSVCVAVARMGQDDELIKSCTLQEMCNIDMAGLSIASRATHGVYRSPHRWVCFDD